MTELFINALKACYLFLFQINKDFCKTENRTNFEVFSKENCTNVVRSLATYRDADNTNLEVLGYRNSIIQEKDQYSMIQI